VTKNRAKFEEKVEKEKKEKEAALLPEIKEYGSSATQLRLKLEKSALFKSQKKINPELRRAPRRIRMEDLSDVSIYEVNPASTGDYFCGKTQSSHFNKTISS